VWDLGGNTGRFSRVAAAQGAQVVCWDIDPGCVEANYQHVRKHHETNLLPLQLDLTNPSPALGWAHHERDALAERGPVDAVMALGLVHHLAISNNVPLPLIAGFFARIARHLIIEFVSKQDSQVRKLLATREDIFPDYDEAGFERALGARFTIVRKMPIPGTVRTLYLASAR
jgi:ribosomal protein L11 methylase PrmA